MYMQLQMLTGLHSWLPVNKLNKICQMTSLRAGIMAWMGACMQTCAFCPRAEKLQGTHLVMLVQQIMQGLVQICFSAMQLLWNSIWHVDLLNTTPTLWAGKCFKSIVQAQAKETRHAEHCKLAGCAIQPNPVHHMSYKKVLQSAQ